MNYFVTGIGTDVGKTVATTVLAKWYERQGTVTVVKPFQTGLDETTKRYPDLAWFEDYLHIKHEPFVALPPACSPHLALKEAEMDVDLADIQTRIEQIASRYDTTLIEGAGGLAVPLVQRGANYVLTDAFVKALQIPIYLVFGTKLGSIHDAVTTASYAVSQGLPIEGVLFNRYDASSKMERDNVETITHLVQPKKWATIPHFTTSVEMLQYELQWEEL